MGTTIIMIIKNRQFKKFQNWLTTQEKSHPSDPQNLYKRVNYFKIFPNLSQNWPKFKDVFEKSDNFAQNLVWNWSYWYINWSLFLQNLCLYGSTLKFCGGTSLSKPNLSYPSQKLPKKLIIWVKSHTSSRLPTKLIIFRILGQKCKELPT